MLSSLIAGLAAACSDKSQSQFPELVNVQMKVASCELRNLSSPQIVILLTAGENRSYHFVDG